MSIPVHDKTIRAQYEKLQASILDLNLPGLTPNMFAKAPQLHMTVLMLDLAKPERFELAKETLQSLTSEIKSDILDDKPVNLTFEGLKSH